MDSLLTVQLVKALPCEHCDQSSSTGALHGKLKRVGLVDFLGPSTISLLKFNKIFDKMCHSRHVLLLTEIL